MKNIYLFILVFLISCSSLEAQNRLYLESSPYLLQHKENPVDWMAWGEEAFAKAKKEHKKIFLSIGYSTCHWCHVMAKESFEDKEIANILNKNFISIKVDKEEMPHVDAYFQDIYHKLHGKSGGWPLSVFMDTEKKIYYISTYIPKEDKSYSKGLLTLLPEIAATKSYMKVTSKVEQKAQHISLKSLKNSLVQEYDDIYGGFGRNKKFPQVAKLNFMLALAQLTKDTKIQKDVFDTLDIMALRGLYDHVEGGFFRYTVDVAWEIPHFEKMLYTQAELIDIYTKAYYLSGKKLYKDIVVETIEMLEKRFMKENLYWSASDADSNHQEGYYFTFLPQNVKNILKNNRYKKDLEDALEFSIEGNFEDRVHLNFYTSQRPKGFEDLREKLQKIREKREYPFIDKKINTAWNAMMISSLYKAAPLNPKYALLAENHLKALKKMMLKNGELYHQGLLNQKVKQKAFLEDYAFFIQALLSGYEYDYDKEKLVLAEYLLNQALYKFYKNGVWYLSQDGFNVRAYPKDKYYTSGVSVIINELLKFAYIKGDLKYEVLAGKSLEDLQNTLEKGLSNAPALALAYMIHKYGFVIIKSSNLNLKRNFLYIQQLTYPFILTKETDYDDYLLCTLRRCFFKDKKFQNIDKIIDENLRKYH